MAKRATQKRRKVVVRTTPVGIDVPERGIPKFEVTVQERGPLVTFVTVKNLATGNTAMTSCSPKADTDAIANGLKVRMYDWSPA